MSTVENNPQDESADKPKQIGSLHVRHELECGLVLSEELAIPIHVEATYRALDPYAVHLVFRPDIGCAVQWFFARELLTTGMLHPSGAGDVRVWPSANRDLVFLSFASAQGRALIQVGAESLTRWLIRTYRLVPPGTEDCYLDLDRQLRRLMDDS